LALYSRIVVHVYINLNMVKIVLYISKKYRPSSTVQNPGAWKRLFSRSAIIINYLHPKKSLHPHPVTYDVFYIRVIRVRTTLSTSAGSALIFRIFVESSCYCQDTIKK